MNFLDLLFPKYCLECGRAGSYICQDCLQKVEPAKLVCPVCKKYSYSGRTHSFCTTKYALSGMHSFYKYDGVIRKAILALKYRFAHKVAEEIVKNCKLQGDNCLLVPIPLHRRRENWRGFNQSAILGRLLAEKAGWAFVDNLLLRLQDSTPQVKLDREHRLRNICGKFAVNEKEVGLLRDEKTRFVIFDDVWTTGATISEAGRVLKKAGAKQVWGMSVART